MDQQNPGITAASITKMKPLQLMEIILSIRKEKSNYFCGID